MCSFTIQFALETRRCLSDKLSNNAKQFRLVFKTESTVYKCHLLLWKYGGACFVRVCFVLFVCLFVFLDVVLFFGCLCLCFFLALCKIRTTSRDTSINEKSTA